MRPIDADALLMRLPDDLPYKASVKRVLLQAPTLDVVPREEVAKIFECLEPNFAIGEFTGSDVFYAIRAGDYNRCKKKYTEVESNG